jgi:hypothetical protein
MNKKLHIILSACAFVGAMALAPQIRAADTKPDKPKHEKKVGPRVLKKYDKNHDGVLDDEEKTAWEADKAKKREERKAKKEAGKPDAKDAAPADDGDDQK